MLEEEGGGSQEVGGAGRGAKKKGVAGRGREPTKGGTRAEDEPEGQKR